MYISTIWDAKGRFILKEKIPVSNFKPNGAWRGLVICERADKGLV